MSNNYKKTPQSQAKPSSVTPNNGKQNDDYRDALKNLIKNNGDDYKGLSELIGRNPSYIQQYIERGTPKNLAEKDRHILARYFGVNQKILGASVDNDNRGLQLISKLSVGVSAGSGNLEQMESLAGKIAFDPKWLRQFPYDIKNLSIVSVDGDSMLPTLSNGDDIMVARHDVARPRDGIYVIRMDDALMVKRLSFGPNRRIDVMSDNPNYSDWHDIDAAAVAIIGPVIWVGRKI